MIVMMGNKQYLADGMTVMAVMPRGRSISKAWIFSLTTSISVLWVAGILVITWQHVHRLA
jgi:hypothetical protein